MSDVMEEDQFFPKCSSDVSDGPEQPQEQKCSVSHAIPQADSPVAAPAAPRVAWRMIQRTAIILDEQEIPSEDELCDPDEQEISSEDELCDPESSPAESSFLADIGPAIAAFSNYLTHPNSGTAFFLEQELWTHLAGNHTRYWAGHVDSQEVDDGPLYAPLDKARREIRVLKVSRNIQGGDDAFQADLVCVSLDDNPAYLAISYRWGDPSIVGHFESYHESQGRRVPYNKGVLEIINTILARGTTLYLWIDALCINQQDLVERASQVSMMGTIFSRARQVVAFIGEADEASTTAMDCILFLANFIWAHGFLINSATAPELAALLSETGPLLACDWGSIRGLTSRPWFHRLWVVQEIALGNDPVLVCGFHALSWCALTQFVHLSTKLVYSSTALSSLFTPSGLDVVRNLDCLFSPSSILSARKVQSHDWPQSPFLFFIFPLNGFFDCSDPRDRIYALLGLAAAKNYRDALLPDYEISVEDLYVKLARQMLMNEGNVNFLHMVGITHRPTLSLPSWVPDWSSMPQGLAQRIPLSGMSIEEPIAEVCQPRFSFDPASPDILTVYGRVADSISLIVCDSFLGSGSDALEDALHHGGAKSIASMDAVMALVHATYPEDQGQTPPSERRPWMKPLMETLTVSGSPLSDYLAQKFAEDRGTERTSTSVEDGFGKFLEQLRRRGRDRHVVPKESAEEFYFTRWLSSAATGRRFYVSSAGHFGLATEGARVGDTVCAFEGHRTPFVVRPVDEAEKSKGFHVIGEAYQHDLCINRSVLNRGEGEPIRLV